MARRRRLIKWLFGTGALLLALPAFVLGLALLSLRVERVRTYVADQLIDLANRNMDEKLRLEGIERLNPWGVRVRHVLLLDEHGRVWVDAHGVDASIDLWSLARNHVDIGHARVDRARIALHPSLDVATPQDEEDDDDQPSGWKVTIPKASVGSAQLDQKSALGALRAHAENVTGGFVWQDAYRIRVSSAELAGELDGRRVLEARLRGSDWSSARGGVVTLEGSLVNARLSAQAELSGLEVETPWPHGDLKLSLRGVNGRTLAALGVDSDWLERPANLELHARGNGRELGLSGELALGKAAIELGGKLDSSALSISLRVPRVRAESVSGKLPGGTLAGQLEARYGFGARASFQARWRDLIIADIQVPAGQLAGRQRGELIVIDALTLAGFERNLRAQARLDARGARASTELSLRDLDLGKVKVVRGEALSGVLNGELALTLERTPSAEQAPARLRLRGKLLAEQLRLRRGRARRVELELAAQGSTEQPRGHALLRIEGLSIARVPVRQLALDAQLAPDGGRVRLEAHGEKLSARLDLGLRRQGDIYHVNGGGRLEQEGEEIKLSVEASAGRGRYALNLGLRGDSGTLDLRAQKSARGLSADFEADDMDLAPLFSLAGLAKQSAELDGSAQLSLPARRGELTWKAGSYRADLSLTLPAAPLLALTTPALATLTGQIEAELHASGSFEAPHAELELEAELNLPERTGDPEQLTLSASVAPESSTAKLVAQDLQGTLLRADAQLGGPLLQALTRVEHADLPSFSLTVQLAPRRLDLMQGVLAYLAGMYALDVPIELGGQLRLHTQENDLRGDASLRVTLFGDAVDDDCVAGAQTQLQVDADLRERTLALRARGLGMRGGKLEAELETRLALAGEGAPRLEPATLHVEGADIVLPSLPGLCGLQSGKARTELHARGLGGARPEAELSLEVEQLLGGDGPALDMTLKADLDRAHARLSADVLSGQKRAARIDAELPLRTREGLPALDLDQPARARVALHDLPVSPFLSLGERLGRPRGSAQGDLKLRGSLRDPQLEGYLELKHVALSIASLAQPLRDVGGRIEVHGRKLLIRELSARDRDGKLRLSAEAALDRDWSGQLSAQLSAERFPIRRQGEVVGELTTKASLQAKIDRKLDLVGDVRIREGRMWLTGETGATVQPLDKHTEVRFVDERGRAQTQKPAPQRKGKASAPREEFSLTSLAVRSDKDIWFMHKSFSVQLGIDLKLVQEQGDEKLVGEVQIRRGHLELLGKPFTIEKGAVRLAGDYPPDPELELKASFEPPAGQTLFVEVHGRASAPIVSFSGAAETAEEAIAIVSGVGTPPAAAGQRAQSDARAFATNLTAGLLSATARRRLGDWVPLLAVESNELGAPTRARAGFDASKLIPPFLKPLARGAYVEGIVGNTKQRRTGSVGVGVRLEVALPRDFVTSLGYGPGPNWETDLSWVP
jgi:hypothetical protein